MKVWTRSFLFVMVLAIGVAASANEDIQGKNTNVGTGAEEVHSVMAIKASDAEVPGTSAKPGSGEGDGTSGQTVTASVSAPAEGKGVPASDEEAYRIGALLSLTGPKAAVGFSHMKTIKRLQDRVNMKGGIHGRPLLIVDLDEIKQGADGVVIPKDSLTDTRGAPATAVSNAVSLIHEHHVSAIIGPSLHQTTLSIMDTAAKEKTAFVSLAPNIPPTDEEKKWVFHAGVAEAVSSIIDALGTVGNDREKIREYLADRLGAERELCD